MPDEPLTGERPGRRTGQLHYLSGSPLDRREDLRTDAEALDRLRATASHVIVPVRSSRILVRGEDPVRAAVLEGRQASDALARLETPVLLGEAGGRLYWLADVDAEWGAALEADGEARFVSLRSVSPLLERKSAAIYAHARALAHFHAHHAFCGRCGSGTIPGGLGNWRRCRDDGCGRVTFPRTDPAIITRLARREECLLVRQPEWRPRQYATVAGFVEPGESLEEAVVREVREEVGLEVLAVSYHSSQPWPFPSGVMIGFDVEVTGDVSLDDPEIEDARWFTRSAMREAVDRGEILLPSPFSISRRLVEDWLTGR